MSGPILSERWQQHGHPQRWRAARAAFVCSHGSFVGWVWAGTLHPFGIRTPRLQRAVAAPRTGAYYLLQI